MPHSLRIFILKPHAITVGFLVSLHCNWATSHLPRFDLDILITPLDATLVRSLSTALSCILAPIMDHDYLPGDEHGRGGSQKTSESMRSKSRGLGSRDVSDANINLRTVPGGIARLVPTQPAAISPRDSTFSQASTTEAHPMKSPEAMSFVSAAADRGSFAFPLSRYTSEADLLKVEQKPASSSGCPTHGDQNRQLAS
jgi:hypothetical protein